jgi:hypothetical protein
MRGNTLSVLSQLSTLGDLSSDPTSMQSVRQALESDANPGVEGASNLFYYLFDDWRAVYSTIAAFRIRLEKLVRVLSLAVHLATLTFYCSNTIFLKTW